MNRNFFHNKIKLFLQVAIILLIVILVFIGLVKKTSRVDFESVCPFGGLIALGSKFWLGSMSCAMSETQVFPGLMLVLGVILFAKLFCGYLCPLGTVTEWLNKLSARLKIGFVLRGIPDRLLRFGKYLLLFFTAYFTATSSELWCKKFDPYYAAVTGFGSDTILWVGILTILTVVVLSVIIRFFWCKYVCPLGALSNIFVNIFISLPLIVLYFALYFMGVKLHILWLILALCLSGALTEVFRFRFFSLSPFRIKVNHDTCTDCGECDDNCPQGIAVSQFKQVTHPDCTLCLDCLHGCSAGSLSMGKYKATWLPPVVLVALIGLGFLFARQFEFKTLSERWGNFHQLPSVQTYEMRDLASVKCWGSAKSLQNKLMKKKGIVGLDAYAKSHHIVIYYDSSRIDEYGLKKAVFSPYQYKIQKFDQYQPARIAVFEIPIQGLWDVRDNADLIRMLRVNPFIVGFETNFGEPVHAKIYLELDKVTPDSLIRIIEQKSYQKHNPDGKSEEVKVDFRCEGQGAFVDTLDYLTFRRNLFVGYDQTYNDYSKYRPENLRILEIGFPEAESIGARRSLKYLTSHVSFFDGTVRVRTAFTDRSVLQVYFDPRQVNAQQIQQKLFEKTLKILTSESETKEMDNPFEFVLPVKVYQVTPALFLTKKDLITE